MESPPEVQLRLLDLQEVDSAVDRLAHRRRTLPELAEIERLDVRLAQLRDDVTGVETEISDIEREQRKVENDVDMVRSRIERDQQRLDTGAVNSAKELESLQHEVGSLAKRRSDLEDLVLEQMERKEEAELRLRAFTEERDMLLAAREAAESTRDAVFAEVDRDSADHAATRGELAAELAGPLLDLYEKVRASSGGVGAAPLHRGRCEGCHLSLPPSDLSRIKAAPAEEVLRCEECRRILVRRPDSGLE
ncbi:MAG TPA: C4-type zinc ribbon domain-containing protein [Mycobacteriales bacterium]|nr:C4-type zinc ribbon domain-containing protein [Mycobacteriales bacterium]